MHSTPPYRRAPGLADDWGEARFEMEAYIEHPSREPMVVMFDEDRESRRPYLENCVVKSARVGLHVVQVSQSDIGTLR